MTKAMKTGNGVTTEKPTWLADKTSTSGQENVGIEDIIIPRLDVLQSISPQRKKTDPAYIQGAEEGMLFNTVTSSLYGDNVLFLPVYFKKEWLVWMKQKAGGGLKGVFSTEDEAKAFYANEKLDAEHHKDNSVMVPSYEIVDTANHYGLILTVNGETEEICVSMSKSKMKVSRAFNTLIRMGGGDRFSRVYNITSVSDKNKQNQDYYNFRVTMAGYPSEDAYRLAEKMYKAMATVTPESPPPTEEKREY